MSTLRKQFTRSPFAAMLCSFFPITSAIGGTGTWLSAPSNGNFMDTANWQGAARPGTNSFPSTDDKAIFNAVSSHATINYIDPGTYRLGAIGFQAGAGAYTFSGDTIRFNASTPGVASVTMDSEVTAAQTFQNTLSFGGSSPFLKNDATSTAATLNFSNVSNFRRSGDTATTTGLFLQGTNTGSNTISGAISEIIERQLSLTKQGAGTWNLSGVNLYTGGTTVSAGTLIISGSGSINTTTSVSVSGSGAVLRYDSSVGLSKTVTLGEGGTLLYNSTVQYTGGAISAATNRTIGGSGSLGQVTVASGGTLTPGQLGNDSVGTLSVTQLTLQAGASVQMDILSEALYDAVTSSGAIQLDGTLYLDFGSLLANGTDLALFGSSSLSGNFSSIVATGIYSGTFVNEGGTLELITGGQAFRFDATSGSLQVIPEPSSVALLGFVVLGAFGIHLRRRSAAASGPGSL